VIYLNDALPAYFADVEGCYDRAVADFGISSFANVVVVVVSVVVVVVVVVYVAAAVDEVVADLV